MPFRDLKWSKTEKNIAREAYDRAYRREMEDIRQEVQTRVSILNEPANVWQLHDYLTGRRREVNRKYDYRYSVLPRVFAELIYDGYLKLEELDGLRDEKKEIIEKMAANLSME